MTNTCNLRNKPRGVFILTSDVIIYKSTFFQRNITMTINHLMMNHRTQLLLPNLDMVIISGLHLRDLVVLMEYSRVQVMVIHQEVNIQDKRFPHKGIHKNNIIKTKLFPLLHHQNQDTHSLHRDTVNPRRDTAKPHPHTTLKIHFHTSDYCFILIICYQFINAKKTYWWCYS